MCTSNLNIFKLNICLSPFWYRSTNNTEYPKIVINAKIKVAVSVDKRRTLIRIYMEKYISVQR